nr:AAA family ATPase [uncultured Dysosmobacter sp.]
MLIQRMSAAFGRLRNETLQFQDGLNIIEAPNETGKSTWCAFLTAMLYGINSRERDKAGFIADKNRYAPWDGSSMSGRLECHADGADITLTRTTRRQTAPMADFQAVYTGTASSVEGLTGANCGETLLGVSREVFERSAFIRQSGLAITQDAGLERRVASLISSGEEDTSYTEAYDALKKQLNRRRFNKSGQLPALESELAEVQQQLAAAVQLQQQLTNVRERTQALESDVHALSDELAQHDQWESAQKHRQLAALTADADTAAQRVHSLTQQLEEDRVPDMETIGRLRGAIVNLETVRKNVEKARTDRDEAMKALLRAEKAVSDSPFAGQTAEEARRAAGAIPGIRPAAWWFPILLCAAAAGLYWLLSRGEAPIWVPVFMGAVSALLGIFAVLRRTHSDRNKRAAYLKSHGAETPEALSVLSDAYVKAVEVRDAAQADVNAKTATAEALYNSLTTNEQAILLEVRRFAPAAFDIPTADQVLRQAAQRRKALSEAQSAARETQVRLDLLIQQGIPDSGDMELSPPLRSHETVSDSLAQAQVQLATARSATDRLAGQLHAMGDPDELRASAESLQAQISQLQEEYDALRLAMDALTGANTILQNRFSPQLSRRTAEIFHELTEGRYTAAALDRSFHLTARPAGDPIDRDIQLLSAGAADQLYLSARLAICELVLPPEKSIPIILDDALTNFDNERCAAALRWLKQAAAHRQILLFTCHSREADFFAGDPEVAVQRL